MSTFLLPFCALALLVVVSGCKSKSDSGSMDSMNMKGDKPMTMSPAQLRCPLI